MPNLYTPEIIAAVKAQLSPSLSRAAAVKFVTSHFEVSERQGRDVYKRFFEGNAAPAAARSAVSSESEGREEPPKTRGASVSISGDVGEVTLTDDNPRTLNELLKACEVDLDIWEVEKHTVNKWEVAMREPATTVGGRGKDAMIRTSDSGAQSTLWTRASHIPLRVPLYQVKAWLRRKIEASSIQQLLQQFTDNAKKHAPKRFEFVRPIRTKADCCYVLNIQDLHLAKLASRQETGGADWDIRIAEQAFRETIDELIGKVPKDRVEEVIVIIGSDMLQVDNDKSTTTAGTYVDSDTRLAKAFDVAAKMLSDVIEKLASSFKVHCVVYGGNHDRTVSLFLGRYIEAWFRNHSNVTIDASPRSRKYHGYGKTLLAFDHGDETKHKDLPLAIMRDNQSTISKYRFTECLVGHLHTERSEDVKGIIIRVAPALCPPDKWHSSKSFANNMRRSQGLLYQREDGLECIYYSKSLD